MTNYAERWESVCRDVESRALPNDFRAVIDNAAEEFGDRIALRFIDDDIGLTYRQLRSEVMRIASSFSAAGIRKGTHVAVMVPNRIEFPLTWLALACIGAVMVPTNTAYTSTELDYMYNDADVSFLVIDRALLPAFETMRERPPTLTDDHVIVVDGDGRRYRSFDDLRNAGDPDCALPGAIAADDLLNIQYTSGTTGFPKGCMQTHRYWIVLGATAAAISPPVRSLLTDHPYFYMDPQWELMWGLLDGVTVYAVGKMSTSRFWERVRAHEIEWAWFPNPILKLPATADDDGDNPITHVRRRCDLGRRRSEEAEARFNAPVRSAYGMTEIGAGTWVPEIGRRTTRSWSPSDCAHRFVNCELLTMKGQGRAGR